MKSLKQTLKLILTCGACTFLLSSSAFAADTQTQAPAPSSALDECSKELLLSYFPESFVVNTLKKFNIPEEKWNGIKKSLSSRDKDIIKIVEEKASAMDPNPLKDAQHRQVAVKLFRETLLQVFTEALKENDVNDTSNFQAMLDNIQQQKAKKFAECMERHKAQLERSSDEKTSSQEINKGASSNTTTSQINEDSEDEDEGDDDESDEDEDDKGRLKNSNAPNSNSSSH